MRCKSPGWSINAKLHGNTQRPGGADLLLMVCYKLLVAGRTSSERQRLHFAPLLVTPSCQAAQCQHASPACKMHTYICNLSM